MSFTSCQFQRCLKKSIPVFLVLEMRSSLNLVNNVLHSKKSVKILLQMLTLRFLQGMINLQEGMRSPHRQLSISSSVRCMKMMVPLRQVLTNWHVIQMHAVVNLEWMMQMTTVVLLERISNLTVQLWLLLLLIPLKQRTSLKPLKSDWTISRSNNVHVNSTKMVTLLMRIGAHGKT